MSVCGREPVCRSTRFGTKLRRRSHHAKGDVLDLPLHRNLLLERKLSLADFCEAPQLAINAAGHEDAPSLIDDALASLELKRNVCLSLNHYSVVTKILRDSDLIAVLPERFATTPDARKEVQVRPLPLDVPNAVLHLSWHQRSNNLPAHQWMKQRLLEAARAFV